MITHKTYSFNELAEMFGMEPKPFKNLMIEMGLMDKYGKPTTLALYNGLLVEKIALNIDSTLL